MKQLVQHSENSLYEVIKWDSQMLFGEQAQQQQEPSQSLELVSTSVKKFNRAPTSNNRDLMPCEPDAYQHL